MPKHHPVQWLTHRAATGLKDMPNNAAWVARRVGRPPAQGVRRATEAAGNVGSAVTSSLATPVMPSSTHVPFVGDSSSVEDLIGRSRRAAEDARQAEERAVGLAQAAHQAAEAAKRTTESAYERARQAEADAKAHATERVDGVKAETSAHVAAVKAEADERVQNAVARRTSRSRRSDARPRPRPTRPSPPPSPTPRPRPATPNRPPRRPASGRRRRWHAPTRRWPGPASWPTRPHSRHWPRRPPPGARPTGWRPKPVTCARRWPSTRRRRRTARPRASREPAPVRRRRHARPRPIRGPTGPRALARRPGRRCPARGSSAPRVVRLQVVEVVVGVGPQRLARRGQARLDGRVEGRTAPPGGGTRRRGPDVDVEGPARRRHPQGTGPALSRQAKEGT